MFQETIQKIKVARFYGPRCTMQNTESNGPYE